MKKMILALLMVFSVGIVWADETATAAAAPLGAMCTLSSASDSQVKGWVKFTQKSGYVMVEGEITGLVPGKHGFHVHEKGDCSAPDATSAGGHFNPEHKTHGAPSGKTRHVGDLGNIKANKNGTAKFKFKDKVIQLSGEDSILDKSLILHADMDDMKTQPTGNAGKRVACGIIELMK
ncbi:MAG TPA: superoxide dismutase family protein [bacterium]